MYKAVSVKAKDDYNIMVSFSDGKVVLYDMKPLFEVVPAFRILKNEPELFQTVNVDIDGRMIFWNDVLNLDTKNVWENGILVEYEKKPDTRYLLSYALVAARLHAGLTQKELSEKTGIYQADISKLERGLGNPSLSTLERLAKGLGKDLLIELREPAQNRLDEKVEVINRDKQKKPFRHRTLEERAAPYGGKLNLAGEYDWPEPVGREVW